MFSYLEFGMLNAAGKWVIVKINHADGLISYEIEFPDQDVEKITKRRMSKGNSDKFIRKIKNTGIEAILPKFLDLGEFEKGDFWHLDIIDKGYEIHFSGPEPGKSCLTPYLQELMELFDNVFGITNFVSSTRIDRIEVEFLDTGIDEFSVMFSDLGDYSHSESLTLDRTTWTLTYSRRFPRQCFHNSFECHCENQIRQILDQTSKLLETYNLDEKVIHIDSRFPTIHFRFVYHDGSEACFSRGLKNDGLGSQLLDALMCVIGDTLRYTIFVGGTFEPYRETINKSEDGRF